MGRQAVMAHRDTSYTDVKSALQTGRARALGSGLCKRRSSQCISMGPSRVKNTEPLQDNLRQEVEKPLVPAGASLNTYP